jgi:hypothetical protein
MTEIGAFTEAILSGEKLSVDDFLRIIFGEFGDWLYDESNHIAKRLDTAYALAHALSSGISFPSCETLLLDGGIFAFSITDDDLSYDCLGQDLQELLGMEYLTDSPIFYSEGGTSAAIEKNELDLKPFHERIAAFQKTNSFPLRAMVAIETYGLQRPRMRLPEPEAIDRKIFLRNALEQGQMDGPELEAVVGHLATLYETPAYRVFFPEAQWINSERRSEHEVHMFAAYLRTALFPLVE